MNKIKLMSIALPFLASSAFAGDILVNQAKNAGIKSCLSTISDLETFFTNDIDYGTWSVWASDQSDDQVFNSTLELTFPESSQLIDLTVAPTKDGQCSYTYTRTLYSTESCMATSKFDMMKTSKYKMEVNKVITGFSDGDSKWLLMPAGRGCIVQKKQIGLRYKAQAL